MPGGNSGGGGQTQNVRPPKYVEDDLVYSLDRAKQLVSGGPSYGLYEGGYPGRMTNLEAIWGSNPAQTAGAYGMSPGQFDAGMRTGVAPLTDIENRAMGRANAWSESALSPLYNTSQQAISQLASQGMMGPRGQQVWDALSKTSGGAYLSPDSNPYLKATYDAAARQATDAFNTGTLPSLTSQFSASGRYGSGAQQNVTGQAASDLQRNLGDMATNIYGSNYQQERDRQEAATGQLGSLQTANTQLRTAAAQAAPGIAGAADAANLLRFNTQSQLGAGMRNLQDRLLGSAAGNYEGRVQNPYEQGSWYSNIINGVPGGLGTTSTSGAQQGGFNAGGAMGGAMGGAALMSMINPAAGIPALALAAGGGGLLGGFF